MSMIALSLLSAMGMLSSCEIDPGPDTPLPRKLKRLQELTIPPGAQLMDEHPPTIQGWIARANWEFEINHSADAYYGWVAEKLRSSFQAYSAPSSPRRFRRYDHGDVETLSIVTSASDGKLRVMVTLGVYPD